ncbi:MAG: NUDIX hydrolase [Thermocrispum sp.]
MVAGKSTIRCVGAVIHDSAGRLLMIKRGHDPAAGMWSLPGGRVEKGESDAVAVARELREETGLEITCGRLAGVVVRGEFEIHDYYCVATGGVLRAGDDAADARWVSATDFAQLNAAGALVDQLTDTLRSWHALPR